MTYFMFVELDEQQTGRRVKVEETMRSIFNTAEL